MASVTGFYMFIAPPVVTKATDNGPLLKIGILGAANIAPHALIYPARSHPEVEVYAVAARDIGKAEKFAKKYGIKKWYGGQDGYQELLNDPAINAVYNPLPNGLRYEWTMKALAAGKHVLLEKPSGDTAEESRLMFGLADRKGLVLLEAFHYRFHPAIQRVKEIIDSGELGSIKEVHASLGFPKDFIPEGDIRLNYSLGGGALMDAGCYTLNCVRYLASGNPTALTFSFPPSTPNGSPVRASIKCDMFLPNWFWFIPRLPVITARVVCDQGTVEVFNYVMPVIYHYITVTPNEGKKRTEKAYAFPSGKSEKGESWWSTYRYQLEAFVDKVRGRTPQPWVSSEDSIANMLWIEKIYEESIEWHMPRETPPPNGTEAVVPALWKDYSA
ncbi:NAD(P)-binding protein [Pisolithus albus]|nr:NAD(P)-binding protein [Pisolithus albus]